ncbi:hypothetical protein AMS68_000778 [Peltaster fructicola]|uniref:NADH:flavin oxidoreductase/NADH oxidase N-terminal domain-containing protein n=1 Tax=Peltaster fructicola TaxID=286661 RepID=A0A6H0XKV4_9PEZI|nr:hypothetical protein AMS68_000778 [Peltaster fructicola]
MTTQESQTAIDIIAQPLTLPCGLTLPNRLVKCPMQETLASPDDTFDPPLRQFRKLYSEWGRSQYGLIITGQVQIDTRFLSVAGDVCCHEKSLEPERLAKWKEWAKIAQAEGTPCIVQLAHPGRMSPAGAGIRPIGMPALCPSSVPVELGDGWLDKLARDKLLGTPKAMSIEEIDEVVDMWIQGAIVARDAGFAGCQLHGAHGFLLSQFLSPHTNRRTDDYGGSPEKRMKLLKRLVTEIRKLCPPPYCLSVKLNSADYMSDGQGLQQDEGLEQVRWLVDSGMVDFVEISGGNAENKTSKLHNSFGTKTMDKAPKRESTRIREAFFTDFAEKVQAMNPSIPIQLSGGFRSRTGMADALDSGVCQLIGLGRAAVLEPDLPRKVLLNPAYDDDHALGMSHEIRGLWLSKIMPAKIVGGGIPIRFFYWNMQRLGAGLKSDPDASLPWIVVSEVCQSIFQTLTSLFSSGSKQST